MTRTIFCSLLVVIAFRGEVAAASALRGGIVDADTGQALAARLYLRGADGVWHHVESDGGRAIPYRVERGEHSREIHTSLSAHPFTANLVPGRYTLTAERGKEYHPATTEVTVRAGETAEVKLSLRRWVNMASRGWFSGDTHVHRTVEELPILLLSEDLNVGLPLTAWVTDSREAPSEASKNPDPVPPAALIKVDATHVIWPVNTEYEIFSIDGRTHTLGAVFVLNHREPFEMAAPPVEPIAKEARRQGALLDLDKHNWPWSMMLVPQMGVDLFELTNNHLWRTNFLFAEWYPEYIGPHMQVERSGKGYTERGWIDFGLQTYYTLLNCGFDLKPSAGTATGVHPVPLGFGRVYVKLDGGFSYDKWIAGLAEGRSFVTTGPMLTLAAARQGDRVKLTGLAESASPLHAVEIVVNGKVARKVGGIPKTTAAGAQQVSFDVEIPLVQSCWVAARVFEERVDGRPRFAHTAPVHFKVAGRPLVSSTEEVEYLVGRVTDELERHEGVLPAAAMDEYRKALVRFRGLSGSNQRD